MKLRYFSETGWYVSDSSPKTAKDKHGNTIHRGELYETRSKLGYFYHTANGERTQNFYNILKNVMETK